MKLTRRSTLAAVAATVAGALRAEGIVAVLTGGACASLYSRGAYQSHDLDFIVQKAGTRKSLDEAMASVGFSRVGDRYVHATSPYFVEFPRGPLAIGDDYQIRPVPLKVATGRALALSPTDSCRDRLAAFYHWSDRQSLEAAVEIARRHRLNLTMIRTWSRREGFEARLEEFERALKVTQRRLKLAPTKKR